MISLEEVPKLGETDCQKSGSSGSFETGTPWEDYTNAQSCDTVNCMTYECTIPAGWEINSAQAMKMRFKFNGKKASENTDFFSYAIFSSIRINDEKGIAYFIH